MRRLFLAIAAMTALLAPAAAQAAPFHPTGEYAQFNYCPLGNTSLTACFRAETTGGFIKMGAKNVPVKLPVVLQGGLKYETLAETTPLFEAQDGNTLTKAAQPVPGGLTGIVAPSWWPQVLKDLFNETINNGFTGVTATLELAGPASSVKVNPFALFTKTGTTLSMPVKVKLSNPFLGSNCYIGSNSSPIKLNLTSGTTSPPPPNTPISGSGGVPEGNESGTILTIKNSIIVDNSFAAPGANGCGGFLFSWLVDPFVNSIVGVPSAAGTNAAVLENARVQLAEPAAVKASE